MKKIISMVLVCTMLLLSSVTVFAVDTETEPVSYDLSELFADYHEYSVSEMVEFLNANPETLAFVYYLRTAIGFRGYSCPVHMAGEYNNGSVSNRIKVLDAFFPNYTSNVPKYFVCGARPQIPDESWSFKYYSLLGEKGDICFAIQLDEEFVKYINSLDYAEGNRLIFNFLMNLLSPEDVVGFSWSDGDIIYGGGESSVPDTYKTAALGDCNGDGTVNGADGYMIKKAILGFDDGIDPLAVDMNDDGLLNAKDSLELKKKIVLG